jgi:hypothetical protein
VSRFYAGIGARATPPEIQEIMTRLASKLENEDWILRSGGAAGADSAFERGVRNPQAHSEIYLPSRYFNQRTAGTQPQFLNYQSLPGAQQAHQTLHQYHPAPQRLSPFAQHLMARNAMQVLGPDLKSPSSMVVAWTPGGAVTGGTGQALRMAETYQIPVRNLGNPETMQSILNYLN